MNCLTTASRLIAATTTLALLATSARAHFPWLATDDDGHAVLFFGESPHDREYKLPDAVAATKVRLEQAGEESRELKMDAVEEDGFIGRRSAGAAPKGAALEAEVTYGIYHGMLLDYYVKGLTAVTPENWGKTAKSKSLRLNATPRLNGDKLELVVQWDGQPLAGAAVTMIDSVGEQSDAETNAEGVAAFEAPKKGLVGFIANRMDKNAKGKFNDQPYTSAGQYATVTVAYDPSAAVADPAATSALPSLPEPLASFGASVCDGWLYVYGGHIGAEHDHSRDNLSAHFRRVKLDGGVEWEELPMQTPLQGLPLVAHDGKLYRLGGLSARNAAEEDPDLHSVAEFACFDPATSAWTDMPPLPEARSSHDAMVVGDVLYVVGGWTLSGDDDGDWLATAWSYDLTEGAEGEWKAVADPPFKRRALAVAAGDDEVFALGGMDDAAQVSRRADVLNLRTHQWTQLPDLPGKRLGGFGVSACMLGGQLFVSGADGVVFRLATDRAEWEPVGKLTRPRFFHRLLPANAATLLAVAGASFSDGHLADIEQFAPQTAN